MIKDEDLFINGDGETSRDFCFIENTVQANLLAATVQAEEARNQVYNVAVGGRTTLNQLFSYIRESLGDNGIRYEKDAIYRDFRAGDVRHSQADVSKANNLLGYDPQYTIEQGIKKAMPWYVGSLK